MECSECQTEIVKIKTKEMETAVHFWRYPCPKGCGFALLDTKNVEERQRAKEFNKI